MNDPREPDEEEKQGFWALLRDVLAFQFKLAADGLRDLFLVPVSIGAALVGIVSRPDDPGYYFRRLLRLGRRSDRWINLFGGSEHGESADELSSDEIVRRVEKAVVSQYERGGIVRTVKDRTDQFVDSQITGRKAPPSSPDATRPGSDEQ